MMRSAIWVALLLTVATPAFAQDAAPVTAVAPVAPPAAPVKPKKICRKFEVTGRRISSTECYTAAQWAEYDKTQNEAATKLVNDVTSAGGKSDFHPGRDGSLSTSSMFGLGPQ